MPALDAFLHAINLLLPAVLLGLVAAGLAKAVWWRALRPIGYLRLAVWACAGAALALLAGLVITGRDGAMATYGLMVLACSGGLAWAGWGRR